MRKARGTGTGNDNLREAVAPMGTLRAAINFNNPLLATRDAQSGELRGLAVDMSAEIARRIGLPMQLVAVSAASQITETARDNVWDVGYLAVDPRRADDIDFTAPYLELEGTFAVSVDSSFSTIEDVDRHGGEHCRHGGQRLRSIFKPHHHQCSISSGA